MPEIEVRLSGTIEVRRDGQLVELPGRRVRALLVLLAVSAGESVSIDTLARGIWDDDPPERVRGSVQTYVGRLRRAIGGDAVARTMAGYTLTLPRAEIDLLRFEDTVASAARCDDAATEIATLESALRLWRGDPFGDVPSAWIERQLVSSWVERHLRTVERRVDMQIAAGDHSSCVPELRDLIERHPLRETLWARLLTALAEGGRTADALERYEVLRTRLAGELGVDPSPELQQIYQRLLAAEPMDDRVAAISSRVTVPHQLPASIRGFTGRTDQLETLDAAVGPDTGARLIALHGPGGVGKTTLAVQWAQRSRQLFPDGQLFVNLRGYGPGEPTSVNDALDSLLRGIGVSGSRVPADPDGRSALLRSELADKRMLLLLDNAREATQVRPLLPGGESITLVTSRSQLRGLVSRDGAQRIPVEPMTRDDSVALLRRRLGGDDGSSYSEHLAELADLCGCLPVALAVAAERAMRDGSRRLELVNERLRSEKERIAALADWDDDPLTGVRAVFSWSYQILDAETARMFRLLGLYPDSQIAVDAAAALGGTDAFSAERLLDRLTDHNLLREIRAGWYEMHDLARAYAAEVCAESEMTADRDSAMRRVRSWYLHSARNADEVLDRGVDSFALPEPVADTAPVVFGAEAEAGQWFAAHIRSIRSVLSDARSDGDHGTVARLAPSLGAYLRLAEAGQGAVELFEMAADCARFVDDTVTQATVALSLGNAYVRVEEPSAALKCFERAQELFAATDSAGGLVAVMINLGVLHSWAGRAEEAIECLERALVEARRIEHGRRVAVIQNNLATVYLSVGRHEEALAAAEDAVTIGRADDLSESSRLIQLTTLGEAQAASALWLRAEQTLGEARDMSRSMGHSSVEVSILKPLGVVQRELGMAEAARRSWEHALQRLQDIGASTVANVTADELRGLLAELPPERSDDDRR